MVSKMPFKPQYPIILHSWGYSCSKVIEGDFVPKGAKQFNRSSQDPNLVLNAAILGTTNIGGIG
jgi:hypothetical protein